VTVSHKRVALALALGGTALYLALVMPQLNRPLMYDDANFGTQHINIALVVLDERGRVLRASVPRVRPGDSRFDPEAQGRDFKRQLDELVKGLPLPKLEAPAKPKLTLPDLCTEGKPNGVRIYLKARMPTFNFSPNELRTLVRFFQAGSSQQEPAHGQKPWPDGRKQRTHRRGSARPIRRLALDEGMISLRQDGIRKVVQGMTTPEEVFRSVYLEE